MEPAGPDGKRVCWSNVQVNILFANGVVGHLTGSYDVNPAHNLERCEVMGTEGRFVLDELKNPDRVASGVFRLWDALLSNRVRKRLARVRELLDESAS